MSRVGNSPIKLPDGVNVTTEGSAAGCQRQQGRIGNGVAIKC